MEIIDTSTFARKRIRDAVITDMRVAQRSTERREDRVPDVDWTGHQYKAPSACRVTDYNHVGRTSTRATR